MVKIVCISDTHNYRGRGIEIPECDILIHSGDATDIGVDTQLDAFSAWFGALDQCKHKVFVPGNHDFICEREPSRASDILNEYGVVYDLNQETITLEGLNIYGEPRQPWFYDWAFNVDRPAMRNVWEKVPVTTDILVTHGPPYGFGDTNHSGELVGCGWQRKLIERSFFRLVVCGHIHTGHGVYHCGETTIVNAAIFDGKNQPTNKPVVIELDV